MSTKEVTIYGAGMSGLIAAIDLVRHGYKVIVHDLEKDYGGDPRYNPSVHTTPIDLKQTSDYIGIDISPVFNPLVSCHNYIRDTRIVMPVDGVYAVERGPRPTSLDTLLMGIARKEGVEFEFKSMLTAEKLAKLPKGTIIACGLREEAYQMLGVPYLTTYGWCSLGETGLSNHAWIWMHECITDYGYMTTTNNLYFNLLFSTARPVSRQDLRRYEEFMRRNEGIEHMEWRYLVGGVVPMASPDNPRLFQKGMILCGTISGCMDPFAYFGILGGILSGKVAAMAVYDPGKAQQEFARFNQHFRTYHFFRTRIFNKIRPQVKLMEKGMQSIGVPRVENFMTKFRAKFMGDGGKPITYPFAIPPQEKRITQ